jgi:hypothetical protein
LSKRAGELFNGETDAAFGDSVFLAVLKDAKTFKSTDTQTGNYNHFWIVDREFSDNRTSRISDPDDGRIPALTPAGEKYKETAAEYRKMHPADGPEDLPLSHRCVTFGVPRLGAGYNSYFQIFQSKDYVAIYQEMIHDVRIVPLDNRPHVNANLRQWFGDSRGHWEGDTLVVDVTNFTPKVDFRGSRENLHLTERWRRLDANTLEYAVTIDDPTVWTKPWTVKQELTRQPEQANRIYYEPRCQEGNYGLPALLLGTRNEELAFAEGRGPDPATKDTATCFNGDAGEDPLAGQ